MIDGAFEAWKTRWLKPNRLQVDPDFYMDFPKEAQSAFTKMLRLGLTEDDLQAVADICLDFMPSNAKDEHGEAMKKWRKCRPTMMKAAKRARKLAIEFREIESLPIHELPSLHRAPGCALLSDTLESVADELDNASNQFSLPKHRPRDLFEGFFVVSCAKFFTDRTGKPCDTICRELFFATFGHSEQNEKYGRLRKQLQSLRVRL